MGDGGLAEAMIVAFVGAILVGFLGRVIIGALSIILSLIILKFIFKNFKKIKNPNLRGSILVIYFIVTVCFFWIIFYKILSILLGF